MLQEVYQLFEVVFGSAEQVEQEWKKKENRLPLVGMLIATTAIMFLSARVVYEGQAKLPDAPAADNDLEDD